MSKARLARPRDVDQRRHDDQVDVATLELPADLPQRAGGRRTAASDEDGVRPREVAGLDDGVDATEERHRQADVGLTGEAGDARADDLEAELGRAGELRDQLVECVGLTYRDDAGEQRGTGVGQQG